jgi:hypothetical protein
MSHSASQWHIQRLTKAQLNEVSTVEDFTLERNNGEDFTLERNNAYNGDHYIDDVDESLPGAYAITNEIHNERQLPLWDANDINTTMTNPTESSSIHENTIQNGEDVPNSSDLKKAGLFEKSISALSIICSIIRYQIFSLVIVLAIVAATIFIGIKVSLVSPAPSPTPSSTPSTMTQNGSPTSNKWKFNSEIVSDKLSFGYNVKLSADGNILAVSSPYYENCKGRFDVYTIEKGSEEITWNHLLPVSGTKVQGTNASALMSQGMSLSADGSTVAIGSPGYGNGLVDIYLIDLKTNTISHKGTSIQGPTPLCEFGFSVALNSLGTRLFVGAPNYGQSESDRIGQVRAYDYNNITDSWIQVGSDMTGESIDSRFGQSIASSYDGSKIIVGAPFDSAVEALLNPAAKASFNTSKVEQTGTFYCFTLGEKFKAWYYFPRNYFYGDATNAQLGYNVAVDKSGEVLVTSQKHIINATVVMAYVIDTKRNVIETQSYPISGAYEDAQFGSQVDVSAFGDIIGRTRGRNFGCCSGLSDRQQ